MRKPLLCFVAGLFVAFSADYGYALYMDHLDKQAFIRSSCLRQIDVNPYLGMALCKELMEKAIEVIKQSINERGFTMIDVGNNSDIADVVAFNEMFCVICLGHRI